MIANPETIVPGAVHAEAIDILSQRLVIWYQQISEMNRSDFPDRDSRIKILRRRCDNVKGSIKKLEKICDE